MREKEIRIRLLVPLAVALVVLLGGFVLSAYLYEQQQIRVDVQDLVDRIWQLIDAHITEDAEMLNVAIASISQDDRLRDALKGQERDALLRRAAPLFDRLRDGSEITHLYFTGPDRVNILRVHKPERYGDRIDRFTTLEAERTGTVVHGIELGPLGTFTLRVVQPWFEDGKLIGFVEIGHEIDHLLDLMRRALNAQLLVMIRKEFLNREDWEIGMRMLGREGNWDRFPTSVAIDDIAPETPQRILDCLMNDEHGPTERRHEVISDGGHHCVAVFPLVDAADRNVGRIIAVFSVSDRMAASVRFVLTIAVLCVVIGSLFLAFFSYYIGRIERRLDAEAHRM